MGGWIVNLLGIPHLRVFIIFNTDKL